MSTDKKILSIPTLGRILLLLILASFIISCGTQQVLEESPQWINDETSDEGESLFFTARGTGLNEEEAMNVMSRSMAEVIFEHMGFLPSDFSQNLEEREYLNRLIRAIINDNIIQNDLVLDEKSWYKEGELVGVAARLKYGKDRYEQDKYLLRGYLSGDDGGFHDLLVKAEVLYDQGFPFSSFLICMDGSELGYKREGLLSGYLVEKALNKAMEYLKKTGTPQLDGPDKVYLGARHSWPFIVNIALSSLEERKIQWSVKFSQPQKGGELKTTSIQLFSDTEGTARFSFPFPMGEGEGSVQFTLQISILSVLQQSGLTIFSDSLENMNHELDRFSLSLDFPVKKDRSVLRTGLVIDDKDVAGKLLNTRTTENIVLASLLQEGYQAEILDFDLMGIQEKSSLEILREFNSQYGNNYDIILYSETQIQTFTIVGDLYQMTAGAVLFEVDLWDHRVNEIGQVNSSVTGGDPARLVTSAFVQLGNDIARTCFELNKN
jgi:hypothetical protein